MVTRALFGGGNKEARRQKELEKEEAFKAQVQVPARQPVPGAFAVLKSVYLWLSPGSQLGQVLRGLSRCPVASTKAVVGGKVDLPVLCQLVLKFHLDKRSRLWRGCPGLPRCST